MGRPGLFRSTRGETAQWQVSFSRTSVRRLGRHTPRPGTTWRSATRKIDISVEIGPCGKSRGGGGPHYFVCEGGQRRALFCASPRALCLPRNVGDCVVCALKSLQGRFRLGARRHSRSFQESLWNKVPPGYVENELRTTLLMRVNPRGFLYTLMQLEQ